MDLNELLEVAIRASLEAGKDILDIYNDPSQDFGIEKKNDNSPLTLADKASHRCIMQHLEPLGIPVLSEEGKHLPYEIRQQWRELWVVDPLDGTKEFIKKNGEFTVNIALVQEGDPILGVIYVPVKETLYYGYRIGENQRAFKAIVSSQASVDEVFQKSIPIPLQRPEDNLFRVVASRSHMSPETLAYEEEMKRIHPQVELVSSGSSIKICLVAEGAADAYPRYAPTMEWDTAAGDAIARAAGKTVINVQTGHPLKY
ncbi:MAG: 3'(2'),5'-bisphosphate nucleotidase CysQ, partial [Bacteroidaceae bacterium]|nr:3'(2'),5'-bisphosphate nucleotidase CysQ [Bacteroidaceae bacterium]